VSGRRASGLTVDGIFWPNGFVRTQSVKEMPSVVRIALSGQTRKGLSARLQQAYAAHATRLVRKVHALLWLVEGKSVGETARTLDLGEQTVRDWLHAFVLEGLASLHYRSPSGRPPKLTESQRRELRQLVLEGPEASGYQSACWSAAMISDLIQLRFKVSYHPGYVCQLLSTLGLSYQRAKFTPDHLGDQAILWLEEVWPVIVRQASEKHALILFGDEAAFAQWGSLSYTWALKGVQPTVQTCGIRRAYRVFGLFAPFQGWLLTKGTAEKLNSESYQAFLKEVLDLIEGFVILIQDNAPYHTSGKVQDFLQAHKDRLAVYQLPTYSPELNPIERVWKKAKKEGTHLRYFPHFSDLVSRVEQTLANLAAKPQDLANLLGEYRDLMPTVA
jgi:transposase